MCRDHSDHKNPYVTAGKVIAIGRIYAAASERGAGKGRATESLAQAIGKRLADMLLDERLSEIEFVERFSSGIKGASFYHMAFASRIILSMQLSRRFVG